MLIDLNLLLEYTDWERQKWRESLRRPGDRILLTTTGANSDARFETVGDLIRHIFSAEKRYIERLSEKPLTDTASLPTENIEVLFKFGEESRKALREFIANLPAQEIHHPRAASRNPSLGADRHAASAKRHQGRLPRFSLQSDPRRRRPPWTS